MTKYNKYYIIHINPIKWWYDLYMYSYAMLFAFTNNIFRLSHNTFNLGYSFEFEYFI